MTERTGNDSLAGRLVSGVLSNWVSVFTSIAVTFFLSPFVVRELGDAEYGVWVLIGSTVGYMVLLDLGLRGAVVRFVAAGHATGDHEAASRAISAALAVRIAIALLVTVASAGLALVINRLFKIPAHLTDDAPVVTFLSGLSMALTLLSGVFGAVLAARQRYDLLSGSAILRTVVTAVGTVALLKAGHGIVGLGYLQFGIAAGVCVLLAVLASRTYPELRVVREWPDRPLVSEMWQYSFYLFLITLSGSLIYQANSMVVGAFVSAQAVTLFAIGSRLIDYHRQFNSAMAQTFTPVASGMGARGETSQLQQLLFHGTRAALLVAWPIEIVLFIRGETFINLWMGPQYGAVSGAVLRVLLLSNVFIAGNGVSANICFGLGRHRPYAFWQCGEALVNLALSLLLVNVFGTIGVAWGTTIPSILTNAIVWPLFICRVLGIGVGSYLWNVWGRTALAVMPFAVANVVVERYWQVSNLAAFAVQVIAVLPVIIVGVMICYWPQAREVAARRGELLAHFLPFASRGGSAR